MKTDLFIFHSEIKKLRVMLKISTFTHVGLYVLAILLSYLSKNDLYLDYKLIWFILVSNLFIARFFHFYVLINILLYNWNKLPIEKKKKVDNTLMILFLGTVGMWLWLPNQKEIRAMTFK